MPAHNEFWFVKDLLKSVFEKKEESEDESLSCFDSELTKESSSQTSIDDFEDEGYNI